MVTTTTANGKTTVNFKYTALTAKVLEVLGACAEYLWVEETDEDEVVTNPFAEATNAEKLAIVDKHIKSVLLDMANSFNSNKDQKAAREAAEASKLEL